MENASINVSNADLLLVDQRVEAPFAVVRLVPVQTAPVPPSPQTATCTLIELLTEQGMSHIQFDSGLMSYAYPS